MSVAVPVPRLPALTYRAPDGVPAPPVGGRVRVPLGGRLVTGCVVPDAAGDGAAAAAARTVRDIVDCLDREPYLPPEIVRLALWVADYYLCGPGEAIGAAMPPHGFRADRVADGARTEPVVRITAAGRTSAARGQAASTAPAGGPASAASHRLGAKQRAALRLLVGAAAGRTRAELRAAGVDAATVARLRRRALVTVDARRVEGGPWTAAAVDPPGAPDAAAAGAPDAAAADGPPRTPTPEQQAALAALEALAATRRFHAALLHGVTGSGKTEVYLRLARAVVAAGRRVLVLVPEIALTPAVAEAFRGVFRARVAIQHSGLPPGARHEQWRRIRRAEVDVVVGTRSAVFAPLADLGLVIVDEEHDASYKQEDSPRYHARGVALVRARHAGALAVLGSATPSLESFHHARRGRYRRVTLTERVHRRPLPDVQVVDMRAEAAAVGPEAVISRTLAAALDHTLARGEQALILLNRRGFAPVVLCRQCGRTLDCPNCSVSLTLHRQAGRARCHYCGFSTARPSTCAHCAGPCLEAVGFGTERIEADVAALCPTAAVARLDRDTARRRGAGAALLDRFRAGAVQVLVGTQLIAKGHDFPNVTLVGVVSADVALHLADFRAAERTFQLLTQVAGRAGRGDRPGMAIVQSFHPRHYSIVHACRQAYGPFFDQELRYRASLGYPPVVSLINAVVRGPSFEAAMRDAGRLAARARAAGSSFQVLGPAVAPIARLRGQHRAQIFLKGVDRPAMRAALRTVLAAQPDLGRRVTIDVDPVSLL